MRAYRERYADFVESEEHLLVGEVKVVGAIQESPSEIMITAGQNRKNTITRRGNSPNCPEPEVKHEILAVDSGDEMDILDEKNVHQVHCVCEDVSEVFRILRETVCSQSGVARTLIDRKTDNCADYSSSGNDDGNDCCYSAMPPYRISFFEHLV